MDITWGLGDSVVVDGDLSSGYLSTGKVVSTLPGSAQVLHETGQRSVPTTSTPSGVLSTLRPYHGTTRVYSKAPEGGMFAMAKALDALVTSMTPESASDYAVANESNSMSIKGNQSESNLNSQTLDLATCLHFLYSVKSTEVPFHGCAVSAVINATIMRDANYKCSVANTRLSSELQSCLVRLNDTECMPLTCQSDKVSLGIIRVLRDEVARLKSTSRGILCVQEDYSNSTDCVLSSSWLDKWVLWRLLPIAIFSFLMCVSVECFSYWDGKFTECYKRTVMPVFSNSTYLPALALGPFVSSSVGYQDRFTSE